MTDVSRSDSPTASPSVHRGLPNILAGPITPVLFRLALLWDTIKVVNLIIKMVTIEVSS